MRDFRKEYVRSDEAISTVNPANPKNIVSESGFIILWDPRKSGYRLPGYKKVVSKSVAKAFTKRLENLQHDYSQSEQ